MPWRRRPDPPEWLQREFQVLPCKFGPKFHQGHRQVNQVGRSQEHHSLHSQPQDDQAGMQGPPNSGLAGKGGRPVEETTARHVQQPPPRPPTGGEVAVWGVRWPEEVECHAARL
jgi:hypothetical protein